VAMLLGAKNGSYHESQLAHLNVRDLEAAKVYWTSHDVTGLYLGDAGVA
jgi:hypothetical protein